MGRLSIIPQLSYILGWLIDEETHRVLLQLLVLQHPGHTIMALGRELGVMRHLPLHRLLQACDLLHKAL
jgi:hypothetical protein